MVLFSLEKWYSLIFILGCLHKLVYTNWWFYQTWDVWQQVDIMLCLSIERKRDNISTKK